MPPRKKAKASGDAAANDNAAPAAPVHSPRCTGRTPDTVEPEVQHPSKQRRSLRRHTTGATGETEANVDALLHSDNIPEAGAAQPRLQPKGASGLTSQNSLGGNSSLPPKASLGPAVKASGRGSRQQAAPVRGAADAGPSTRHGELDDGPDRTMDAVVKVFCIHCEPNFSLPWQRKRQYSSSSSGFILSGHRILTNAHCVDHHTQVKVKRRGSEVKFVAAVLAVGTECDIALLTVEDPKFWEGVEPVTFGELPQLQDAVTVVGYPIGGDTMSVTSGVVSRIEVTSYVHGAAELLGVQIDAAINSGNSGGPAFNDNGECVGIAFQSLKHEDAENIGYVIPTPVINHFLADYERNGTFTGFPCLGVEWQKMENPDLREALGMKSSQKGVMVRRLEPTCEVSKLLKPHDILLSFDGVAIANDGTVPFRSGERISFSYLVSQKYTSEKAVLEVLHGGVVKKLTVKLQAPVRLVPFHIKNQPPSYFIVAGLVFTAITVPYLRSEYGKEFDFDAPVKLLDKMMHELAQTEDQQVVVLAHVLAAEANIGYEDIINTQVVTLNGTKINNLRDLVNIVDGCSDKYLTFDLDYGQKVVLHARRVRDTTKEILTTHCIARDRSADLVLPGAEPVEVPPVKN